MNIKRVNSRILYAYTTDHAYVTFDSTTIEKFEKLDVTLLWA